MLSMLRTRQEQFKQNSRSYVYRMISVHYPQVTDGALRLCRRQVCDWVRAVAVVAQVTWARLILDIQQPLNHKRLDHEETELIE